jgi:hypothetical protein
MQWFYMRRSVEALLTCALIREFAESGSIMGILHIFYDFDVLKQLGTTLALFIVLTGIGEMCHTTLKWARSVFRSGEKNARAVS